MSTKPAITPSPRSSGIGCSARESSRSGASSLAWPVP
jgi:hypothetical protein